MYIQRIKLKNIRGFTKLDFDLSRPDGTYHGWTVFTGNNGAGKSALLKAIGITLIGQDAARALQNSFYNWIRVGQKKGDIELKIIPDTSEDRLVNGGSTEGKPLTFGYTFVQSRTAEPAIAPFCFKPSELKSPARVAGNLKIAVHGPWANQPNGWFCCGYGPFRRISGASSEGQQRMTAALTNRFVTLFREDASLLEVERWLMDLHTKRLENKAEYITTLQNVTRFFQDEFTPNGIIFDHVDSDGIWLKDRNGLTLTWHDISDGYRAALALLGDILRHMIDRYGNDIFTVENGTLVVSKPGVVLIDEIDVHLHPEWQIKIGFWLKEHFPKIQFIITTHSPLICQAADKNGIFHLPEPGDSQSEPFQLSDSDYQKIIASRPDQILLTPAFGLQNTRSPYTVEKRQRFSTLRARQKAGLLTDNEKNELEQLELFIHMSED